ncbi:hypothetical protein TNCV_2109851 [Trichonephila clavipes]|nr:hypothetical protein TNCV_2109851 [Trichonephila clavipes]
MAYGLDAPLLPQMLMLREIVRTDRRIDAIAFELVISHGTDKSASAKEAEGEHCPASANLYKMMELILDSMKIDVSPVTCKSIRRCCRLFPECPYCITIIGPSSISASPGDYERDDSRDMEQGPFKSVERVFKT